MNIICFSNIDWKFLKQRHQHLMEEFAVRNEIENIIFVETLGCRGVKVNKEDFNRGIKKIREICLKKNSQNNEEDKKLNKIKILTPKFIPIFNSISFEVNKILLKKQLDKIILENNIKIEDTIAWTMSQNPTISKILKEYKFKKKIFDCIDDIKSIPNVKKIIIKTEEKLIKESDIVFATSNNLHKYCSKLNKNVFVLKNGVKADFLENKASIDQIKNKKIVGYVGTIYEWFDAEQIIKLAKTRKHIEIILAGPIRIDSKIFEKYPNIKLLGEIKHELVKEIIQKSDVCIIPFILNELIKNTNPVKIYEYFSMGKPVVASKIPELQSFSKLVYLYDENNFVDKIDEALEEKKDGDLEKQRIEIAKMNTWESKVNYVFTIL